jgi:hypothetical protein
MAPENKRPLSPTELKAVQLGEELAEKAAEFAIAATPEQFTHLWNHLSSLARNAGILLPGDGRGGLLPRGSQHDNTSFWPYRR